MIDHCRSVKTNPTKYIWQARACEARRQVSNTDTNAMMQGALGGRANLRESRDFATVYRYPVGDFVPKFLQVYDQAHLYHRRRSVVAG
jgi:hypothetical protein